MKHKGLKLKRSKSKAKTESGQNSSDRSPTTHSNLTRNISVNESLMLSLNSLMQSNLSKSNLKLILFLISKFQFEF
jgi:hypothetical protein